MKRHLYALSSGRMVELRWGKKEPEWKVKKFRKKVPYYKWDNEAMGYFGPGAYVKKEKWQETSLGVWKGGRSIRLMKNIEFRKLTGHLLKPGTVWTVPVSYHDLLLNKESGRRP